MRIIKLDDPLKIIAAKQEVESKLLEDKKIEKEFELQEFIKYLSLQNTIYVKNDTVVPFRIFDDMLFITADDTVIKEVSEYLASLSYDLSKLTEVPMVDVYNGELDSYPIFFIINSKYMVLK